ncbi:MAG: hypothetical protein K1060chlam1_00687 [Candidatus Anoxychlamydiales bacterium]|nr:hypothetical protein [Candidatus Anoxychlamydiales bacterium]
MFKTLVLLFVLSISTLKAEENSDYSSIYDETQKNCSEEPKRSCPTETEPCCKTPPPPSTAAYNAPARIDVCDSTDIYFTASFIYWKIEENIFVSKFQATDSVTTNNRSHFSTMNYDYKPGFKIGLGYNFEYDDWNAYIEYTWYHATNSVSRTRPSWASFMAPVYNRTTTTSGSEIDFKLKLDYDFINLDLSRWQYEGQKLLLKALIGLHGSWLDQDITSAFNLNGLNITNNALFAIKQWAIGPRIGFFYKWKLLDCFSITGKGTTALLYQKFTKIFLKQDDQDTSPAGPTTLTTTERKRSSVNGLFELMLGLEFDKYFDRNKYHFNCSAGYDLHGLASHLLPPGWLALHGLTLTARFDF